MSDIREDLSEAGYYHSALTWFVKLLAQESGRRESGAGIPNPAHRCPGATWAAFEGHALMCGSIFPRVGSGLICAQSTRVDGPVHTHLVDSEGRHSRPSAGDCTNKRRLFVAGNRSRLVSIRRRSFCRMEAA